MSSEPLLVDEYQLLNPIATGNFTTVWEVVEKGGGTRHYAMKLLLPEAFQESEQKAVLKHEAKIAQQLQHPNFVQFHKIVMNKKLGYLVMDYFRAPNLKTQITADFSSVQVRFVRLAEQLCQALAYMHDQGYLHRDIKPDNILFNKGSELRLIDFSLSSRIAGAVTKMLSSKRGKLIQGTRTYIAPETILKAVPTVQTDIYSLGVTFFELLTGEPPFKGSSPDELLKKHVGATPPDASTINRNVTPEMDRLLSRMLAKKPKNRHSSMHEVYTELRALRVFKEDAQEVAARMAKEREAKQNQSLDKSGRLDSRADALRVQMMRDDPEYAKLQLEEKKKRAIAEKQKEQEAKARAQRVKGSSSETENEPVRPPGQAPSQPRPAAPPAGFPPVAPGPPPGMPQYPPVGFPAQPYGAPQYGMPPGMGYPPVPPYGVPQYGTPMYGMPTYGAPPYGQPPQGIPFGPPGQLPQGAPPGMPPGQQPMQQPVPRQPVGQRPAAPAPGAPSPPGQPGAYWQELPPLEGAPRPQQPQRQQPAGSPRPPAGTIQDDDMPPMMDQLPPVE